MKPTVLIVSCKDGDVKARRLWPKDCIWVIDYPWGFERYAGTPKEVCDRMLRKVDDYEKVK